MCVKETHFLPYRLMGDVAFAKQEHDAWFGAQGGREKGGRKSKKLGTAICACYRKDSARNCVLNKIARLSAQAWNPRHLGGSNRRTTDSRAAWAAEWIQDQAGQSSKTQSQTNQN